MTMLPLHNSLRTLPATKADVEAHVTNAAQGTWSRSGVLGLPLVLPPATTAAGTANAAADARLPGIRMIEPVVAHATEA